MKLGASKFQNDLARRLRIEIDETSFAVAAAQIHEAVAPALWLGPDRDPATPKQIEYAALFGVDVTRDSKRVASAKIQEEQDERNKLLIEQMNLQPGSVVLWKRRDRRMVISSIAKNCRLWFKGGNGYGAFPHEIEAVESGPGVATDGTTHGG